MSVRDPDKQSSGDICDAGSDCPNLSEVEHLRNEIRKLADQVRTDALTDLYNFRYFSQALSLEMERSRRSDQPTCLIMCDLDHFKEVNDVHGHEVGNEVLKHVSSIMRNAIRRLDIPCRYGGEEFAIILPDTTLSQGVRFANRLRLIIQNSPMRCGELMLGVEASLGVDVYEPGDEVSEKEFVERVDTFLYQAKAEGRNRVCHAELPTDKNKLAKASA